MSNPSQGYKLPESSAGSGQTGLSNNGNPNQSSLANPNRQPETTAAQEGITLSNNFTLGNTKAEAKGEPTGEPLQSHEVDMPASVPGANARQTNEGSNPPHKSENGPP